MIDFTAVATLTGLTFVLASLLVLAERWLRVDEDPRIEAVEAMLPHTNCGACGFPGCHPFAEALVAGEATPSMCTVGTGADHTRIAQFLGVEVGFTEKRVARLACAGGDNVSRNHAHYSGIQSCAAATLVAGGGKGCFWGCLGIGDCESACTFGAITMDAHRLPVADEERCTACGDCVTACPKDLFSLHPVSHRLWVSCRSHAAGDAVLEECAVGCTACGKCAADAPGLITMRDNLPVIVYNGDHETDHPIQRCPTGAIVWFEDEKRAVKGHEAHKVVRREPLRDAPT